MEKKQLYALPSTTFNSSCQRLDIVLTKDGIRTLIDIVIIDPTQTNLFPWSCAIQGFVASNAAQAKEMNFCNQHPTNQFLPLTIEVFGCLYKHANVFLHNYANAIWNLKGTTCLHLFYLGHFSSSKNFDHITKDANIFHLKLGDSHRFSYLSTSTPSKHTSHHHGQSIASH